MHFLFCSYRAACPEISDGFYASLLSDVNIWQTSQRADIQPVHLRVRNKYLTQRAAGFTLTISLSNSVNHWSEMLSFCLVFCCSCIISWSESIRQQVLIFPDSFCWRDLSLTGCLQLPEHISPSSYRGLIVSSSLLFGWRMEETSWVVSWDERQTLIPSLGSDEEEGTGRRKRTLTFLESLWFSPAWGRWAHCKEEVRHQREEAPWN